MIPYGKEEEGMGDLMWKGYEVYEYDEGEDKRYFSEFIEELLAKRLGSEKLLKELATFLALMEDVEKGKGIEKELIKQQRIKKIKNSEMIWEYRIKDNTLKKHLRIYLGVVDNIRTIVILHANFKTDSKTQERDIEIAQKRLKVFLRKRGVIR